MTLSDILAKHKADPSSASLLGDLVALWQETRSPRLADAIERLGLQSPNDLQKRVKAAVDARPIGELGARLRP
jgi:hypothetical protein